MEQTLTVVLVSFRQTTTTTTGPTIRKRDVVNLMCKACIKRRITRAARFPLSPLLSPPRPDLAMGEENPGKGDEPRM